METTPTPEEAAVAKQIKDLLSEDAAIRRLITLKNARLGVITIQLGALRAPIASQPAPVPASN